MTTTSYSAALERALRAAQAAGADDVEVGYVGTELSFARFASSRFTQVGVATTHTVRVRALVGRRLGAQTCATLQPDALDEAAAAAVAAARTAPELDVPLRFATGSSDSTDAELIALPAELDAERAPARIAAAFAVAADHNALCAGSLKVTRRVTAVRTSAGLRRDGADGTVDAQLIALDDDASGFAGFACPLATAGDVPWEQLAQRATDKVVRGRGAAALPPARYDVVLAPEAVAELLEWMSMASFGARAVHDGTSLLAGRAGQAICSPRITVVDRSAAGELAFDGEGSERRAVALIDEGRAGEPVTDLAFALRAGAASTGHAPMVTDDMSEPMTRSLHLAPGARTEDELIAAIARGIYVTRLHYVNGLLDTRRATTTGMTRDGAFAIENGELAGGVRDLRFTDSVLDMWSDARLIDLGAEQRMVPTWWSSAGLVRVPALAIRGFAFTGASR